MQKNHFCFFTTCFRVVFMLCLFILPLAGVALAAGQDRSDNCELLTPACSVEPSSASGTVGQATKAVIKVFGKNLSAIQIIKQIESRSRFYFSYNASDLEKIEKVSVDCNGDIETVLNTVFADSNVRYMIKGNEIILKLEEPQMAQQPKNKSRVLKGKILDASTKEPVIGAVIQLVGGGKNVSISNLEGEFDIEIIDNVSLLVSCMGYISQTVRIGKEKNISIMLSVESQTLDNVVVTAFGAGQKKESVVGSIQLIRPENLKVPSSNLSTSFAGRLAGVVAYQRSGMPGQNGADFFIRGISTISGVTSPLIILDGVEVSSGDLNALDPEIIEGFSILKDATATAMYGTRGANGVMIITTKSGIDSEKPIIGVRVESNLTTPTKIPEFVDGFRYMELYNEAVTNQGTGDLLFTKEQIEGTRNHLNPYVYPNVNWYNEIFKNTAFNQKANFYIIDALAGEFRVFNKNYYTDLSGYEPVCTLYGNGHAQASGSLILDTLPPRTGLVFKLDFPSLSPDKEYYVVFRFVQKEDMPWADKGYVQAEEQILVSLARSVPAYAYKDGSGRELELTEAQGGVSVSGDGFKVVFDHSTGGIQSLRYGDAVVFDKGEGPALNSFRAFVNNDNWFYEDWFKNGLHNLKHRAVLLDSYKNQDGSFSLIYKVISQAPNSALIHGGTSSGRNYVEELTDKPFGENDFHFTTRQVWTVYPDGAIRLLASVESNKPSVILPKLGYIMRLPCEYETFTYYGRGPADNYADRKSGQFIGVYKSSVCKEYLPFPKPQNMGNHEDTRWCELSDSAGCGVLFIPDMPSAVSVSYFSPMELTLASHPYDLPVSKSGVYLCIDKAVTGLGGNSCGQGGPLEGDVVKAVKHDFGFVICPVKR